MARSFDGTNDQLQTSQSTSNTPSGFPFTISAWARNTATNAEEAVCNLVDVGAAGNDRFSIRLAHTAGVETLVQFFFDTGASQDDIIADITGSYTVGDWIHYCLVCRGDTDKEGFVDGVSAGSETNNHPYIAADRFEVGYLSHFSSVDFWEGDIAELAMWDRSLSDDEITALSSGISPLAFADSLVNYWPLIGRNSPENDLASDIDLTVTGATVSDHPRIIYPYRKGFRSVPGASLFFHTAAAVGTGVVGAVKQVNNQVDVTATGVISNVKQVSKNIDVTAIGTALVTTIKTVLHTAAVVVTGVVNIVKLVDKEVSVVATGDVSVIKQINKVVSTTATGVVNLVKNVTKNISIVATGINNVVAGKIVPHVVNVVATATAGVTALKVISGQVVSQLWRRRRRR